MSSFHVKFVQKDRRTDDRTDEQTDNGKTICPPSFDTGGGGGGIKNKRAKMALDRSPEFLRLP